MSGVHYCVSQLGKETVIAENHIGKSSLHLKYLIFQCFDPFTAWNALSEIMQTCENLAKDNLLILSITLVTINEPSSTTKITPVGNKAILTNTLIVCVHYEKILESSQTHWTGRCLFHHLSFRIILDEHLDLAIIFIHNIRLQLLIWNQIIHERIPTVSDIQRDALLAYSG